MTLNNQPADLDATMSTPEIKHIPLQWGQQELECFKTDTAEWLVAAKGDVVAVIERNCSDEEQKAKAESLVTAVNSHHALQARVKELEEALKEAADKLESHSQGVVEIDAYEPVLYVQPDVISSTLVYPIQSRKMAAKVNGWGGCTVPLYASPIPAPK
jgi:hypothetical protein